MSPRIGCCKICLLDVAGFKSVSLPCWHIFHSACLKSQMQQLNYSCPTCLQPFSAQLNQIRISKTLRKKGYTPSMDPIIEELSTQMDSVSILESEFLYQTSYQYPSKMISRLSATMLISEAKNAAKNAHEFANKNPIKALKEAVLAQWMLKHVKKFDNQRMEATFEDTQANISWIISRQKDILKFFVQ
uniref:RING-type domain-containing protein n=1 Tax=Panagrolaimus sp. PS1159 TaxID=55785 RepID=A0AC35FHW2_9BILA